MFCQIELLQTVTTIKKHSHLTSCQSLYPETFLDYPKEQAMGTVRYHAPLVYGNFLGRRSIESLNGLEGLLDVSIGSDKLTATISPLHVPSCEGIFCKIDDLGYGSRSLD